MIEIHGLPMAKNAFVKKISVPVHVGDKLAIMTVVYARNPRDGHYKMHISENGEVSSIYQHKEEVYPKDELDTVILEALKKQFGEAEPHTSFQMFDTEQESNRRFVKDCQVIPIRIAVTANPQSIMYIDLRGYMRPSPQSLGIIGTIYPIDMEVYTKIKYQMDSLHNLETII